MIAQILGALVAFLFVFATFAIPMAVAFEIVDDPLAAALVSSLVGSSVLFLVAWRLEDQ